MRLYRRIGREVKLMLYRVRYAVSYKVCKKEKQSEWYSKAALNTDVRL